MNVSVREKDVGTAIIADIKTEITENLLFRNKPLPDVRTARNRAQLSDRHTDCGKQKSCSTRMAGHQPIRSCPDWRLTNQKARIDKMEEINSQPKAASL